MTEVSHTIEIKEFCPFDLFTGLKAAALEIAYHNGCIHDGYSESDWLKAAAIPVMEAPIVPLIKLDEWLKTLDQDQLAAGELKGRAPDPKFCNALLNKIMETNEVRETAYDKWKRRRLGDVGLSVLVLLSCLGIYHLMKGLF